MSVIPRPPLLDLPVPPPGYLNRTVLRVVTKPGERLHYDPKTKSVTLVTIEGGGDEEE